MSTDVTVVISDLHLGSRHANVVAMDRFFDRLDPEVNLVMNGDVLDVLHDPLDAAAQAVLDRIVERARMCDVTWLLGNHDDGIEESAYPEIRFGRDLGLGRSLYINHGWDFDEVMPGHRRFIRMFKVMHRLRVSLGAEPVHVAQYAKRWGVLYRYLRRKVMLNAVDYARSHGYAAVTCGHTHYPDDLMTDGVRYLNTGAWTESPMHYVRCAGGVVTLETFDPGAPDPIR